MSERFSCRTIPGTFEWFQDLALEHGYVWGEGNKYYNAQEPKGRVSGLLEGISYGEFLLFPSYEIRLAPKLPNRVSFSCRTSNGTMHWFREKAKEFGYIYGSDASVSQFLEAIVSGKVLINKII
jgi:hypothetical protein